MCPCSIQRTLVPNRATRNSNTRQVLTLKTQTRLEKTWKTRITRAKTWNTQAKVELDTCLNSTVWNSMKLELDVNSISWLNTLYEIFSPSFSQGSYVNDIPYKKIISFLEKVATFSFSIFWFFSSSYFYLSEQSGKRINPPKLGYFSHITDTVYQNCWRFSQIKP